MAAHAEPQRYSKSGTRAATSHVTLLSLFENAGKVEERAVGLSGAALSTVRSLQTQLRKIQEQTKEAE
eukprot:2101233-Amphidinium_carterae.1